MPPSSLALPISTSRPQWAQTWSRAGIPMRPRPQFPDLLINQLRRMERVSCSAHVGGENSKSVERLSASERNSPFICLRHNGRSAKLLALLRATASSRRSGRHLLLRSIASYDASPTSCDVCIEGKTWLCSPSPDENKELPGFVSQK